MKKLLFIICLLTLALSLITGISFSQNARITKEGNYVATPNRRLTQSNSFTKNTGKTFTDSRGTVWPVYLSPAGKVFVLRISAKTGNTYRQYLKL